MLSNLSSKYLKLSTTALGINFSRSYTTGRKSEMNIALDTIQELKSTATNAQFKITYKRQKIEPKLLRTLERILAEVYYFIHRGSDKFFMYNSWSGGYEVYNLAMLMEEVAGLTRKLEDLARSLTATVGPFYTLSNGVIL